MLGKTTRGTDGPEITNSLSGSARLVMRSGAVPEFDK
jgi:hypothetical protein